MPTDLRQVGRILPVRKIVEIKRLGGGKTKMAAHYSRESITTILEGNGGLHVIGPDRPVLSSVHYK